MLRCRKLSSFNGMGAACYPVSSKRFKKLEQDKKELVIWLGKREHYCNQKESSDQQNVVGFVQMDFDKTACLIKWRAFVMYSLHANSLNFSTDFRKNPI